MKLDVVPHLWNDKEILLLTEQTYDVIADEFAPILKKENSSVEERNAVNCFIDLLPKNAIIADLGCGVGKHGRYCAEKGFTVYGFDISSNMINLAQKYNEIQGYARMEVLQIADMSNFDSEQKFDAVISAYAFIHLTYKQSENALKNLQIHLKDHAFIFITVYQGDRNGVYEELLAPNYNLYFRDYEKDDFVELISKCGYKIIEYKEWSDLDPITASNSDCDAKVLCIIAEYRKNNE